MALIHHGAENSCCQKDRLFNSANLSCVIRFFLSPSVSICEKKNDHLFLFLFYYYFNFYYFAYLFKGLDTLFAVASLFLAKLFVVVHYISTIHDMSGWFFHSIYQQ
jgi:hypothetical protein